jgi:hypothetical protein
MPDTPRDPLAALLHKDLCDDGHEPGSPSESGYQCTLLAARLRDAGVTLDATRPSGDEALRDDEVLALIGPDVEGLAVPVAFSHPHDPLRCPACDIVWSQGYATASKDAS